jgi:hypothetical protein
MPLGDAKGALKVLTFQKHAGCDERPFMGQAVRGIHSTGGEKPPSQKKPISQSVGVETDEPAAQPNPGIAGSQAEQFSLLGPENVPPRHRIG